MTQRLVRELARLGEESQRAPERGALVMIGRRQLRSHNSWLHNSRALIKGPERCALLMHPDDALARGLGDGDRVSVSSRVGSVTTSVSLSDEMMPGVVSLPHGFGHALAGARLPVAAERPGVSANAVTDDALLDHLTGNAAFSELVVEVLRAEARADQGASEAQRTIGA